MLSGHTYWYEESCVNTLLPPTVWYFFSIAFLTAASSLYVMNTNPLLFSVFGSCGSSIFSIYKRGENAFYASIFILVCLWRNAIVHQKTTSPKAPKYSSMTSFAVSGLRPPTKIFLTGSFFIAKALLGSITLPSSLCSFCASTFEQTAQNIFFKNTLMLCTIQPLAVQLFCFSTHLLHTGCIFEENEAKTSWPAGVLVDLYGAVRHFSKFIEVILQVFLTCVPAKTTDKHFPRDIKRPGMENVSTVISQPLHRGTTRLRNGGVVWMYTLFQDICWPDDV